MGMGGPGGPGPNFNGGMNAWSCDGDESFGGPPPSGIGGGGPPMMISPKQVLCWLDMQDPAILRRVMYHCKWVLEQRGLPSDSVGFTDLMAGDEGNFDEPTPVPGTEGRPDLGDMSAWYEGATQDEPDEGGGEDGGPKKVRICLLLL